MRKEASYDLPKLTAASAAHQYQRTEAERVQSSHMVGFVAVFIDFMSELGVGLDIADERRNLIFKAVKEAGELKK